MRWAIAYPGRQSCRDISGPRIFEIGGAVDLC
jgi:hypothetical protein